MFYGSNSSNKEREPPSDLASGTKLDLAGWWPASPKNLDERASGMSLLAVTMVEFKCGEADAVISGMLMMLSLSQRLRNHFTSQ